MVNWKLIIDSITKGTNEEEVMDMLLAQGKITSIEAITLFGNTRLSATIWNLRHKHNIPITTSYKTVTRKKDKRKVSIGVYELERAS
jgi:hypothetical protein